MSPKILVIQFRKNAAHETLERASLARELGDQVIVEYRSALDSDIDWHDPAKLLSPYHGLILGGSGDFDFDGGRTEHDEYKQQSYELLARLQPLLTYIFAVDFPTLGICFGHQIIGAHAGAKVYHDPVQKKSCSHTVAVIERVDDYMLDGVPATFAAHYGHKDSLDRVPDGATLLIHGGEKCRVSALRYRTKIYTTQFHPELTLSDLHKRLEILPGYLPEGVSIEEVFVDDIASNKLLHNFATLVIKHSQQ
jgi:GMP synthase (glutamine-hydrolysing)